MCARPRLFTSTWFARIGRTLPERLLLLLRAVPSLLLLLRGALLLLRFVGALPLEFARMPEVPEGLVSEASGVGVVLKTLGGHVSGVFGPLPLVPDLPGGSRRKPLVHPALSMRRQFFCKETTTERRALKIQMQTSQVTEYRSFALHDGSDDGSQDSQRRGGHEDAHGRGGDEQDATHDLEQHRERVLGTLHGLYTTLSDAILSV